MSDNPILDPDQFYTSSEPEQKPTDKPEAKPEIQAPSEGKENIEEPVEPEEKPDETEDQTVEDEDKVIQVVEIKGKEYTLDEVEEWRNGHLRQSDYTKKTTQHARQREKDLAEIKVDREKLAQEQSEIANLRDQLSALVSEDEQINWAELKDEDPERYIELKEKADKRKSFVEKAKQARETPVDDPAIIENEREKLFSANPEWLDKDGKATEVFEDDTKLMNEYAVRSGYNLDKYSKLTNSVEMITILKAAKYDQLQEKSKKIKEKREKIPVVSKPKAKMKSEQPVSTADSLYPTTVGR